MLDAAGLAPPKNMQGKSWLKLAVGSKVPWRQELLYEYFWEREYPQTPTIFALRDQRWKLIRAHGLWDIDELYDLEADPGESRNLIAKPEHAERVREMGGRLVRLLGASGGAAIPLSILDGPQQHLRRANGSPPAAFPPWLIAK